LEELDCSQNKLSVLDLTNCQNLIELKCQDNELEKIKLTTLPHLKIFQA
jgi:Leucine-rich repeat (LRR) protein